MKELIGILNYDKQSISNSLSSTIPRKDKFWSSNIYFNDPFKGYVVDFGTGEAKDHLLTENNKVRCVSGKELSNDFKYLSQFEVLDNATGLIWQKEQDLSTRIWRNSVMYCEESSLSNNSDWRLPTVKELASIIDYNKYSPAIDNLSFKNTISYPYWTSTSDIGGSSSRLAIHFESGEIANITKEVSAYSRCVRGKLFSSSYKLPDSGQNNNLIGIYGTDGDYLINGKKLFPLDNQIILDNNTKLKWQKVNSESLYDWDSAINYCNDLNLSDSKKTGDYWLQQNYKVF